MSQENDARQEPPCIHTVETGKHEWNALHSVHQAHDQFWFRQCPTCGWIDTAELVEQGRALGLQQATEQIRQVFSETQGEIIPLHNDEYFSASWVRSVVALAALRPTTEPT